MVDCLGVTIGLANTLGPGNLELPGPKFLALEKVFTRVTRITVRESGAA